MIPNFDTYIELLASDVPNDSFAFVKENGILYHCYRDNLNNLSTVIEHQQPYLQQQITEVEKTVNEPKINNILVVVSNSDRLRHTDNIISSILLADKEKYKVLVVDDGVASGFDADEMDLVIITDSTDGRRVLAKFRDVTIPVLLCEMWLTDDMQMSMGGNNTRGVQNGNTLKVINDDKGFFEGLTLDANNEIEAFRPGARFAWAIPSQNAKTVAVSTNNNSRNVLFYFDKGDLGELNYPFPAMRVFFGLDQNSRNVSNTTASLLLNIIKIMLNEHSI